MPEHRDHEVRSRFEDEGIPDLQEETPGVPEAGDAEELPLPGTEPGAVLDHGTTAEEQLRGEPLDARLAREEPDVLAEVSYGAGAAGTGGTGGTEGTQGTGGTDIPGDPGEALELERATRGAIGFDTDAEVEPAGRLVEPDEGARTDDEPDAVAADVGTDLGGFTAEEDAVRVQHER